MSDLTKLNESIAKLSSALERFFGAQDPPVHASDQPGVDAAVKQLDAIVASIPDSDAKRPFVRPEKPSEVGKTGGAPVKTEPMKPVFFPDTKPVPAMDTKPAEPVKTDPAKEPAV
jgi:hypothetical protein